MGRVIAWARSEPLTAVTLSVAIAISSTSGWLLTRLASDAARDRAVATCRADYDTRYNAALLARADAVDEVIYRIAIQARNAGQDETRKVLARYLTARSDAARRHPLPDPPAC